MTVAFPYSEAYVAGLDAWGKTNGMTIVYAPWHQNPEFRIFKTGSLMTRNNEYPSGIVIVPEPRKGDPYPWNKI